MGFFNFKKDSEEETREKELYYDLWRASGLGADKACKALTEIMVASGIHPDNIDFASDGKMSGFEKNLFKWDDYLSNKNKVESHLDYMAIRPRFSVVSNYKITLYRHAYIDKKMLITSNDDGLHTTAFLIGKDGLIPVYDARITDLNSTLARTLHLEGYGAAAIKHIKYHMFRKGSWIDYALNHLDLGTDGINSVCFGDIDDGELFIADDSNRYIYDLIVKLCKSTPEPHSLPAYWQEFLDKIPAKTENALLWRGLVIETDYVWFPEEDRFFVVYDMYSDEASMKVSTVYAAEAQFGSESSDIKPLFNYVMMQTRDQNTAECIYKDSGEEWLYSLKRHATLLKDKVAL